MSDCFEGKADMAKKKSAPKKSTRKTGSSKKASQRYMVSKQNFSELTGFTLRHISRLMKQGLPFEKVINKDTRRPQIQYNYDECVKWMAGKGILPKTTQAKAGAEVAAGMATQVNGDTSTNGSGPKLSEKLLNEPGIEGSLERLKLMEYNASRVVLRKLKSGAPESEIDAHQKIHTKAAQILRHTESAVMKHKQAEGKLVEFQPMVALWVRTCVAAKNAVLGVPNSCIPRLLPLFKDQEKGPIEAEQIIEEECMLALNSINPDEIPIPDKNSK